MKEFIKNEMMVHVPLCTHKDPKNVLIIGTQVNKYKDEVSKHNKISASSISTSLDEISKLDDNSFDIVICDSFNDLGDDKQGIALFMSQINRILKDDGLINTLQPNLDDVQNNKILMGVLGNYFKIIMPYNLGDGTTALLSSKEYHPTADINLHRADMLDGLDFYNCDVHPAAFAMGNNIRRAYLGVIRN